MRPIDLRRKEFKSGFRGYDTGEVDDFLDSVADEFERISAENQRMRDEISSTRKRVEHFEELEGSIQAALVQAERAANDIRQSTDRHVEDLRQSANREAELTIREAKARAHQILADSSARVEQVQESYETLRKAKQIFAADFRRLLQGFVEVMDNVDVASAKEIEASLRERLDLESVVAAREAAERERIDSQGRLRGEQGSEGADEETTRRIWPEPNGVQEEAPPTETEEPEVEPSSVGHEPAREMAPEKPDAASEVDREEPGPTGEGGPNPRNGGVAPSDEEGARIQRASQFVRRLG